MYPRKFAIMDVEYGAGLKSGGILRVGIAGCSPLAILASMTMGDGRWAMEDGEMEDGGG
jgi:hypothetical protein